MKILLLADHMESGGAETHVAQLAIDLTAMGHRVLLWCAGGRLARELEARGVTLLLRPKPSRNPLCLWRARRCLLDVIRKEGIDLLHAHTRLTAILLRGMHRRGVGEVVTVHARFRTGPCLSRLSYWGRNTVAVSEDLCRYLQNAYRLPPFGIRVIPNGIDCTRFCAPAQAAPRNSILFVSRLDRDCSLGAELLCTLAPLLCVRYSNLQITLAGGGSEYQRLQATASKVNRAIGRPAVVLTGSVSDPERLYRKHAVFVGVSRAAMEASACGCAVILCGNEGYGGVLSQATLPLALASNLCARGEPLPTASRLLADLCRLLDDPHYCNEVSLEAHAYVCTHLDSRRVCRKTLALYRDALPQKAHRRLVIGGYFGCGNLGDDAILEGLLYELSRQKEPPSVCLLSGRARGYRSPALRSVFRKNLISVTLALARANLFLLGGGSLLQNSTGNASLLYYLGLLRLSRFLRCRTALYAAGIGPICGARAIGAVARVLAGVDHTGLRDPASYSLLRRWGLPASSLSVGADAAFLLPPPTHGQARAICQELGLSLARPLLGIVLRGGAPSHLQKELCSMLPGLCRRYRLRPVLVVLDRPHDTAISQAGATQLSCVGAVCAIPQSPRDAAALLSCCRAVVSARLHGAILSTLGATPSLLICTDPSDQKIPAFAKEAGLACMTEGRAAQGELTDAIDHLLLHADARLQDLSAIAAKLRKKAQKDLEKLLQIVYNKG